MVSFPADTGSMSGVFLSSLCWSVKIRRSSILDSLRSPRYVTTIYKSKVWFLEPGRLKREVHHTGKQQWHHTMATSLRVSVFVWVCLCMCCISCVYTHLIHTDRTRRPSCCVLKQKKWLSVRWGGAGLPWWLEWSYSGLSTCFLSADWKRPNCFWSGKIVQCLNSSVESWWLKCIHFKDTAAHVYAQNASRPQNASERSFPILCSS